MKWIDFIANEVAPGWYAVVYCWDAREGFFSSASFWNGAHWRDNFPIIFCSSASFDSEDDAIKWAGDNDFEDEMCGRRMALGAYYG